MNASRTRHDWYHGTSGSGVSSDWRFGSTDKPSQPATLIRQAILMSIKQSIVMTWKVTDAVRVQASRWNSADICSKFARIWKMGCWTKHGVLTAKLPMCMCFNSNLLRGVLTMLTKLWVWTILKGLANPLRYIV